jgi:uncharacterized membrane protein required for colicin V production
VNLADFTLGLAFVLLIVAGLRQGLLGFLFMAAATLLSLVSAGAAALWVSGAGPGMPRPGLALAIPAVFFITLFVAGACFRFLARNLVRRIHRLPFGAFDRLSGAALTAVAGVTFLSLAVYAVLLVPVDNRVTREVESATSAPLVLGAGAELIGLAARPLPFLSPLADRLAQARDDLRPHRDRA